MMKNVYRSLKIASVLIFLSVFAYAQKQVLTGKVTDPSGTPLPGVTILVKGTSVGTSSDAQGVYSLEASGDDVLVFSFIGYASKEISVGAQSVIDVAMTEDVAALQEIVVVGYGTQKKVLNTGANLQVAGENLQRLSTTNALQALQGQAPGVQITSTSGQPGSDIRVVIRGQGTTNGSGPLYVVDGVLTGDITYLNNNDIESISVLKDAASAAIYGSQSANGVILVTTKSGKSGKSQITFDTYYGVQNVAKKIDMPNSQEYATLMNEAAINSGKLPYFTSEQIAAMTPGTKWMDQMFAKDVATKNYSFGASGGSETSTYSASLSYVSQGGIVGGPSLSNYDRYNFRINSQHKLYKNIVTLGENLSFAYTNNNGIGVGNQYNNSLRAAFNTSPFVPMYDANGNFYDNSNSTWNSGEANPYAVMVYNNQNSNDKQKLLGNLFLQIEPIKGLKYRTSIGMDYNVSQGNSYTPVYKLSAYAFNPYSKVSQYSGKGQSIIFDYLLSYAFQVQDHQIDLMVGTSYYENKYTNLYATNGDAVFNTVDHGWITTATNKSTASEIGLSGGPDDASLEKRSSYFGRLNYNYKEKYLFNATFRADGSSKFAPGHQWGYFPSVSAGWVMTNEEFLQGTSNWLNSLKLRGSWGQVGNQRVPSFQYMALMQLATTNYTFGSTEGLLTPGAYPLTLSNPNLTWETSEQSNIGFDAKLLSGKLTASLDWYSKTTKGLIVQAPVLATAGANAPYINAGNVYNKGVELALNYSSKVGELNYSIGANGAYNHNEMGNIGTADGIIHGQTNQLYANSGEFYRAENGHPIGYFWGLKANGIFQTEDEVNNYKSSTGKIIQPTALPGDVRYVDRDGNGVIDDKDRSQIGNPNPTYTFGFNVAANYKGFDLVVQANGVAGNQIVQSYRELSSPFSNYTTQIFDRWHGPGSSNTLPRLTEDNRNWTSFSSLYIHNGDFLRISNITLGYNLNRLLKGKILNSCRLYASVLNAFTFTKYTGMDPEVGFGVDPKVDPMASGVDVGYYPRPRTYMVGMNIKF
ncbi:MAG TPA: TonB-dependent receptor [Cyclobacteriaceae bacterium]|nr:TonB-dependent receptor [Cyclobacteriaceae bacterium]